MKNLAVLGSSGSIGRNTLRVAERFPEEFNISGLAVFSDTRTIAEQIRKYKPSIVCVAERNSLPDLKDLSRQVELVAGDEGLEKIASHPDIDIVVNGIVGFAGLRSTLAAAGAGKRIALANKESMVAGGELVNSAAQVGGAEIIPVDSEHSAIFQCLKAGHGSDVKRIILTSSGGPFREIPAEKFDEITVEMALFHPTWKMGRRITIDSATLMNKGMEIIEAHYLFGIDPKRIDVVIHPQSIVHSLVEFRDGAIMAQLSRPDMRLPIEYALFYPRRGQMAVDDLSFKAPFSLDFEPPDEKRFPSLELARSALAAGKTAPAVFNAADEVAVSAFLNGEIGFQRIFGLVEEVMSRVEVSDADKIEAVVEADRRAREVARGLLKNQKIRK